jgi:hypothetical protein
MAVEDGVEASFRLLDADFVGGHGHRRGGFGLGINFFQGRLLEEGRSKTAAPARWGLGRSAVGDGGLMEGGKWKVEGLEKRKAENS